MANQFLTTEQAASFYAEPSPCTPPADFAADGTRIEFISINLDGVKQELLVDPTAEDRHFAVGTRARRPGRRNGTFSLVTKMHGTGTITADGDTVAQTYLGTLLAHCMGGVHLGTARVITGGSATVPELDSVTGIVPGCMLAFEDASTPADRYDGFPVCRRVLSITGLAVTLSEALPWTPAADDPVHPCVTLYLDAHVLRDATAAAGTLCWYVRHGDDESLNYRLDGCVLSPKIEGLAPGGLPSINFEGMCANFLQGTADGLADIADLGTAEGEPQLSMSLDVTLSIQEVGTTTVNLIDPAAIAFEPGYARSKVETVGSSIHRFHGLATYSVTSGQTKFNVTVAEHTNEWYAGLQTGKRYRITLTQPGAGAGAGAGFCIHLPNARLVETPGKTAVGDNHGMTLAFEAAEAADTTGGSNVNLQKSRFVIALF